MLEIIIGGVCGIIIGLMILFPKTRKVLQRNEEVAAQILEDEKTLEVLKEKKDSLKRELETIDETKY